MILIMLILGFVVGWAPGNNATKNPKIKIILA